MTRTDPEGSNPDQRMREDLQRLSEVKALGAMAGLEFTDERAAIVAAAIEAWRPLLESLDELDLADFRPGPIFDARWGRDADTQ